MSEEISVKPEELFADLTKLVAKVEGLPDGASQCVAAPPYGDSVAGFGEQYDWFLADLAKAVRATKQTIAAAGAQIREAVVMLAAQDEALKAEADAVVGMLDAVLPPIPARAAPRTADQTYPQPSGAASAHAPASTGASESTAW